MQPMPHEGDKTIQAAAAGCLPDGDLHRLTRQLRRLARSLVACEAEAEDLVQEAWVAALAHPPRDRSRLGNWLAVALRNRARSRALKGARREARERAVARCEAEPAEDRLVASRTLLDAVDQLEEPFRSAVVHRFLDGLPPREIARRLGIPVETARSRVRRGLVALRARLEEGGAAGAVMLLATGSGGGVGAGTWSGVKAAAGSLPLLGVVMQTKVIVVAAVLLAAPAAFWWFGGAAVEATAPLAAEEGRDASALRSEVEDEGPVLSPRQEVRAESEAGESDPFAVTIVGRCVEAEGGAPVAGAEVRFVPDLMLPAPAALARARGVYFEPEQYEARSRADGTFELAGRVSVGWRQRLEVRAAGFGTMRGSYNSRAWGEGSVELGDVRLARGVRASLRLVDEDGAAQEGLTVSVKPPGRPATGRLNDGGYVDFVTDAAGRIAPVDPLVPGRWSVICRDREIVGDGKWEIAPGGPEHTVVVRRLADVQCIEGVVVDAVGAPIADVAVQPVNRATYYGSVPVTDANGRFSVQRWSGDASAPHRLDLTKPGWTSVRTEPVAWGTGDLRFEMRKLRELDLCVVDAETGAPVERFGVRDEWDGEVDQDYRTHPGMLEAAGEHPGGRVQLGLDDGKHRLFVQPLDGEFAVSAPLDLTVGEGMPTSVIVRVERLAESRVLVVDADGVGVVGSRVTALTMGRADRRALDPDKPFWGGLVVGDVDNRPPRVELARVVTTDQGVAVLRVPQRANLTLHVTGTTHRDVEQTVVFADASDPFVVKVSKGAVLEGTIGPAEVVANFRAMSGSPSTAPTIQLVRTSSTGEQEEFPVRAVAIGEAGTFRIERVPPGVWDVELMGWYSTGRGSLRGVRAPVASGVQLEEGATRELKIDASTCSPGTLRGRVVVAGDPTSRAHVQVRLTKDALSSYESSGFIGWMLPIDEEGRFELTYLPGTVRVAIDRVVAPQAARVEAGKVSESVFTLSIASVEVGFVDESGEPVPDAVGVVTGDGQIPFRVYADSAGRATYRREPGVIRVGVLPAAHRDPSQSEVDAKQHGTWPAAVRALARGFVEVEIDTTAPTRVTVTVPSDLGY